METTAVENPAERALAHVLLSEYPDAGARLMEASADAESAALLERQ
jgi:hypothetical protein